MAFGMNGAHPGPAETSDDPSNYLLLAWMMLILFIIMYILMFSMVNSWSNVWNNLNQVYMAGLMVAPMVIVELMIMRHMYPDQAQNLLLILLAILAAITLFVLIRQQIGVGNVAFLRSMIPHHASALLMCQQACITDPEVRQLCDEIDASQTREIQKMKRILKRLQRQRESITHR